MKKILALLLALSLPFALAACGNSGTISEAIPASSAQSTPPASIPAPSEPQNEADLPPRPEPIEPASSENVSEIEPAAEPAEESGQAESTGQKRVLVAYFSWAENAVLNPNVDAIASASVISPGNVAQLAGWVQGKTGGDLFSIRVIEPYSSDWGECLDRANREKGSNARPELAESVENMDDYDVVFLGYPNWWYSAPMAIFSFLEQQDLSGKTVYLFCSHGTGGLASSVRDITATLPNSEISENVFDVNEEDAASSQEAIENWLDQLGY